MITFSRVSLIYPHSTTTVIEDLSFEIAEGEMVLVMGHTGSGKSSLLRLINGLVPHHTGGILGGEIIVDGKSTRTTKPGQLAGIVGIVGQNPLDTFVTDTVEEELAFGMESLNFPHDMMRKRVEEALDQVGLTAHRNRTIATLSGGEQQRLAIASALVMHPKVLVLDEPTSALDPIASEEILAILHRLVHDLSVTVVLAEHRLERVIGYVDRILLIEGDGATSIGAPAEILKKTDLVPPIVRLTRALALDEVGTSTREVRRITENLRNELPESSRPLFTPGETLLSLQKVQASYGTKVALKDVSIDIKSGEITALMGRNGAGKSSLIKCAVGLVQPESGKVRILGEDIADISSQNRSKTIGYIPQEPGDLLYLTTVQEECDRADRDNSVEAGSTLALLHSTLPTVAPSSHPRDLSEGERLALVLAIVLSGHPKILILDEPTRGLDYEAKNRLMRELHLRARENGIAILMATHDVEIVAEVADRTIFLADGEKVADGSTLDVLLASPAFAPQVAKVMSPRPWLTVSDVLRSQENSP
ncbi:COG1123 ATPase components of various ABC-type transport systems, contain duplicated ATPase [Candidatus Nanopelagicaceae bacterium]